MNYNKQLYDLYEQHWDSLVSSVDQLPEAAKPAHPLLLQLPDEQNYKQADIKVMFVGQETNGWNQTFGSRSITELQESYCNFITSKASKNSIFWTFIKSCMRSLEKANPNDSISMSWNNIYKLGRVNDSGSPSETIREVEHSNFNVFEKELTILHPDIVVFLLGLLTIKHSKNTSLG